MELTYRPHDAGDISLRSIRVLVEHLGLPSATAWMENPSESPTCIHQPNPGVPSNTTNVFNLKSFGYQNCGVSHSFHTTPAVPPQPGNHASTSGLPEKTG